MVTDGFINYLKFEKRYSPHTITAYKKDLDQFDSFLVSEFEISSANDITYQMVRTWIVSLIEQDISPSSVNRKLSTLKSYFKFMTKEGLVQENPMPKIQSPKTSKKLPVFVDNESMETLFSAEIFSDDFEGIRDRLILEMFYMTGIRLSELINLKDPDIDFESLIKKVKAFYSNENNARPKFSNFIIEGMWKQIYNDNLKEEKYGKYSQKGVI